MSMVGGHPGLQEVFSASHCVRGKLNNGLRVVGYDGKPDGCRSSGPRDFLEKLGCPKCVHELAGSDQCLPGFCTLLRAAVVLDNADILSPPNFS